ncbi:MAG: 50S ribosomal protein L11 [archaeon]
MQIKLLIIGGDMKPNASVSQKLGPLGLNMGKIIADANKATTEFKGIRVPIVLDITTSTKQVKVEVLTPPTSELIKKEIGVTKGSGQPNNLKIANLPLETIIKVAKIKEKNMITNNLNSAVNSVLGTCVTLGVLVESKDAREVIEDVTNGKYNDLISQGKEEASEEKIKKLEEDFKEVEHQQESFLKALEAKKAKEAEAAAPGATPAEGEKKEEEKKEEPAKKK